MCIHNEPLQGEKEMISSGYFNSALIKLKEKKKLL